MTLTWLALAGIMGVAFIAGAGAAVWLIWKLALESEFERVATMKGQLMK